MSHVIAASGTIKTATSLFLLSSDRWCFLNLRDLELIPESI